MTDQNDEVRKVCERGLFLIAGSDVEWQERIKNERFCWHNAQWLEAIAKTNLLSSGIIFNSFFQKTLELVKLI